MSQNQTLVLLVEELRQDQRVRWQAGDPVAVEAYLQRYPALQADLESALELVYREVVLREACGEAPQLEEYLHRFPELAPRLQPLFEVHQALQSECLAELPDSEKTMAVLPPASGPPPDGGLGLPAIPGFEVLRELGRGGMGVVYWAWQSSLNRPVALKMLLAGEYAHAEQRARFQTEAEAVGRLQHPQIVQVFQVDEHAGRPFLVMEYVAGGSLAQKLTGTPLPGHQAAQFVETVALAVQAAHACGIVHRDLNPANILLRRTAPSLEPASRPEDGPAAGEERFRLSDYEPKVTDFGLAKLLIGAGATRTQSGAILGTPSYMAPEQAAGQSKTIGPAADLYGLGAILYELLTGRPPFRGETPMDTLLQVQTAEPVPPRRLQPNLPRDLETICVKCLAKDPRKRYGSAALLAEDLGHFLAGEPIRARPVSRTERLGRWCRRNPVPAGLIGAVAFLLVVVAVVSAMAAWQLRAEQNATRLRLYEAKLAQAKASRGSRQAGQRFLSWKALAEASQLIRELKLGKNDVLAVRKEAIACLALADVHPVKMWPGWPPGMTTGLAFDADQQRYARSDRKGNVSVRRVADDRELARLPGEGDGGGRSGAAHIAFSPDGALLAVLYWHQVAEGSTNFQVWDWRHSQVVWEPAFPVHRASLAFSPDGRRLALGQQDGTVTLHEVTSGKETNRLHVGPDPWHLAFSPDSARLAVAVGLRGEVRILDLSTGKVLFKLPHPARVFQVAWHPDGVLLAAGCHDSNLHLWDTERGQQHRILQGHQGAVVSVNFVQGGRALLSTAWDGTSRLWEPWSGQELVRLDGGVVHASRDGHRLACREGHHLVLWELAPGHEYYTLPKSGPDASQHIGGFSPDGRWLALATDRGVRLWDFTRGTESAFLPLSQTVDVKFHPSGRELVTSGPAGLYRWPFRAEPGRLRIGPVRKVLGTGGQARMSFDREGHLLAAVGNDHVTRVIDFDNPPGGVPPLRHTNAKYVAMSPDGRWVTTAPSHGSGVNVWDAGNGKHLRELIPEENNAAVAFSPDGRWLLTVGPVFFTLWEVGSWKQVWQIDKEGEANMEAASFTPDGQLLAVVVSLTAVELIEPATGRSVARLQPPDTDLIEWLAFSPDGGQLVVTTRTHAVRVWDLRAIRRQLQDIGMDWDRPALPPPPPAPGDAESVRVEVDFGELDPRERGG
jgi:serine/threonine protein kinase/WD40 repeat protein